MWNKFVDILQQPASKRLGLAIGISALFHLLFFGNMDFTLPSFKQNTHLIEARIQMPPMKIPKVVSKPMQEVVPETLPEPTQQVIAPKIEVPIVDDEAKVEVKEDIVAEPAQEMTPKLESITEPQIAEPIGDVDPQSLEDQQDLGLGINENAYPYLETEFDVRTAIDGSAEGKAKITYEVIENMQYRIKWLTEGTGFMALLFPDLLQTSNGQLTKSGLQPNQYAYQFGKKADKSRSASFDWHAKKVVLQTAKGTNTEDFPEGTQDLLSFMYQFMYVPPLQHMQVPIVNGKKLRIYDYSFEGEEQVNSALGQLKTIHILHSGSSEEEKTELWLAIDYQYIPVKIRKIESDGSVVEMQVTRITTNRPVIDQ